MRLILPDETSTEKTPIGELPVKDYSIIRWSSGKIFIRYLIKDLLGELVADMRANTMRGYDNVICIDGGEGSGKSNLAWQICQAYDDAFSLKNYVYNMDGFKEFLEEDFTRKTIWMDEGSNIANNREWNTEENKALVLFMETMRSKNATFVMCIPVRDRMDIYLRDHRIRYMIHCEPMTFEKTGYKERGYFELRKRDEQGIIRLVGYGEYDPMPEIVKTEYEELKSKCQDSIIKKIREGKQKNGQKYKEMYEGKCKEMDSVLLALYESGHDKEGLMQLFGIDNESTFKGRIKRARART